MADKRKQRISLSRHYDAEQNILTPDASRLRRLRRSGSSTGRKPLPIISPRPRMEQVDAQSTNTHRERRVIKTTGSSTSAPPVMARGGMESMAVRRPRHNQPKRRFDISIGSLVADTPGAEIRLPALPRIRISWGLITSCTVIMLLACLLMIWKSPAFQISDIHAVGLERLTLEEVTKSLGVQGVSVLLINTKELEQSLMVLFPELSSVDIQVSLPNRLKITADERQPVIAWTQDDKELWIDAEGVSFLPRGEPASALVQIKAQAAPPNSLPVQTDLEATLDINLLSTAAPQMRITAEMVSNILALNAIAPQDTLLLYNAEYGLGWNDKQHGWRVFFGEATQDVHQKLLVYQTLAARLEAEDIQPEVINMEYLHAPYFRMER